MKATATWRDKFDEKIHDVRTKTTCLEIARSLAQSRNLDIAQKAEKVLKEAKIFHDWMTEK